MERAELAEMLELHKKWLDDDEEGAWADLKRENLQEADLKGADLQRARLQEANLQWADLQRADLKGADLQEADLKGADLDYSCFPLWCGSLGVHFDERILTQLLYHVCYNTKFSKHVSQEFKDVLLSESVLAIANKFHRVEECGRIEK